MQSFIEMSSFQDATQSFNGKPPIFERSDSPVKQSDLLVKNVQSKMKSLESKYIDLAQFYKESSVKQSAGFSVQSIISQNESPLNNNESQIINDLMKEKRELDANINNLQFVIGRSFNHPETDMTASFQESYQEIFDLIDSTQVQSLHVLSQKQNEMFVLASKNKIPSTFRNDSLGLWYDAKSGVLQCIAELKSRIVEQKQNLETNNLRNLNSNPSSFKGTETNHTLSSMQAEFTHFKKISGEQCSLIGKIQQTIDETEVHFKDELAKSSMLLQEVMQSLKTQDLKKKPQTIERAMSPFEKRVASYQSNSVQRSIQNRPNSRGAKILDSTPSTTQNADELKSSLDKFKLSFDALAVSASHKENLESELTKAIEMNIHEQSVFINQTENIISYQSHSFQQLRELVNDSTAKSHGPSLQQPRTQSPLEKVNSNKLIELQQNNDQLFVELRKANEKYLDVRVENNKLSDQIALLIKQNLETVKQPLSNTVSALNIEKKSSEIKQLQFLDSENRSFRQSAEMLCNQITVFLTAMRKLQKAVNRKDKEMAQPKLEFESSKKELETLVSKVKLELTLDIAKQIEQRTPTNQTSKFSKQPNRPTSAPREYSVGRQVLNNSQSASQRTNTSQGDRSANLSAQKSKSIVKRVGDQEDVNSKLNSLIRQVKNLQLEKDKQKELIDELRHANSLHQTDREHLEEKIKSRAVQIHKFALQCQLNAIKVQSLELTLQEYKQTFNEITPSNITQLRSKLGQKENELKQKLNEEQSRVIPNTRLDPMLQATKDELLGQLRFKERELEQQYGHLKVRLDEHEADLLRVKALFISKLKELEISFTEISQEVVETDNLHSEVTEKRKKEEKVALKINHVQNVLERSVDSILAKFDKDDREQELEKLATANQELLERNEKLKNDLTEMKTRKDMTSNNDEKQAHSDMMLELNDQIEQFDLENDKLRLQLKELQSKESNQTSELENLKNEFKQQEQGYKKEVQTLKYENKRQGFDLKDSKDKLEKTKTEYDIQFQALKATTLQMRKQMQKEYEQRVLYETKLTQTVKQLKLSRTENAQLEGDITKLIRALEEMKEEQKYLQEMRGIFEDDGDRENEDEQFERKISEGAEQAAAYYKRIADQTRKEFKCLSDRLDEKQNEFKKTENEQVKIEESLHEEQKENGQVTEIAEHNEQNSQNTFEEYLLSQEQSVEQPEQFEAVTHHVDQTETEPEVIQNTLMIAEALDVVEETDKALEELATEYDIDSEIKEFEREPEELKRDSIKHHNVELGNRDRQTKLLICLVNKSREISAAKLELAIQEAADKAIAVKDYQDQIAKLEKTIMEAKKSPDLSTAQEIEKRAAFEREKMEISHREALKKLQEREKQLLQQLQAIQESQRNLVREKRAKLLMALQTHLKKLLQNNIQILQTELQQFKSQNEKVTKSLRETEAVLNSKTVELQVIQSTMTVVQQTLKEESLSKSKQIADLQNQLKDGEVGEISVSDLHELEGFNSHSIIQPDNDGIVDEEDEVSTIKQIKFGQVLMEIGIIDNEPLEIMRQENDRKQAVIDELRLEMAQLKNDLEEAVEQFNTKLAEESKQPTKAVVRTSINSFGGISRDSWASSSNLGVQGQVEEHLKHVRSIMIQFLSKLPFTTKENEDILPVIYSMLNFSRDQIGQISKARSLLEKPTKKGLFGGLMKK